VKLATTVNTFSKRVGALAVLVAVVGAGVAKLVPGE